jgi:hypothetical protein
MTRTNNASKSAGILLLILVVALSVASTLVAATPAGGAISNAVTETAVNRTPGSRSDPGGTITTMVLTSVQQNNRWKAYVGNVSGTLTLDDATNFTIYDWDITSFTGEVYASRNSSISWSSVSCANVTNIQAEASFMNMTDTSDDLNSTFNWSVHKAFTVGTTTLGANTCNSTVTYVNDTRQVPTTASPFQEILIKDANNQFAYLADISDNVQGFDNQTYDFQLIVPEYTSGAITPYYFYAELN